MSVLSRTQAEALAHVADAKPDLIQEYDREPLAWVRYVRQSTAHSLQRKGLVDFVQPDYPVGGYRAHLTEAGLRWRERLQPAPRETTEVSNSPEL